MPKRIPSHKPRLLAGADRAYERSPHRRDDKGFYSSVPWVRLRDLVRAEEPLCRACLSQGVVEPGTQVDHITPRKLRPDLSLVRENLQSLCLRCHNAKRASE